jgi:hypothetical protein
VLRFDIVLYLFDRSRGVKAPDSRLPAQFLSLSALAHPNKRETVGDANKAAKSLIKDLLFIRNVAVLKRCQSPEKAPESNILGRVENRLMENEVAAFWMSNKAAASTPLQVDDPAHSGSVAP